MTSTANDVWLIRHGETEWSRSGRHTGLTDLPLTDAGRRAARALMPVLARESFVLVLTSPLTRAQETCGLAGLGDHTQVDADLVEWNYGEYEGLTTAEIHERAPGWLIFTDGAPGGERPEDVGGRADRVIARARAESGQLAIFAHGHLLRVLAARWLGWPVAAGRHLLLDTGTVNILSAYWQTPAIKRWNAPAGP
ncbi:MAG TPA: histidine phosphatase family protein [Methylomirabilota bacterium]|jgi:probable phosphoglycerate mutase|nr:histidine phosphatase family protein [Methylomirabilota bacterium]